MALLNLKEGSRELRISAATLRRFAKNGKLPYRRIGAKIFFLQEDIDSFLQRCLISPNNQVGVFQEKK